MFWLNFWQNLCNWKKRFQAGLSNYIFTSTFLETDVLGQIWQDLHDVWVTLQRPNSATLSCPSASWNLITAIGQYFDNEVQTSRKAWNTSTVSQNPISADTQHCSGQVWQNVSPERSDIFRRKSFFSRLGASLTVVELIFLEHEHKQWNKLENCFGVLLLSVFVSLYAW